MIKQLWFHHLFSLFLWPFSLHSSCSAFFVGWFLLSEGSNIFLNARTLLLKFGRGSSRAFIVVSARVCGRTTRARGQRNSPPRTL